LKIIVVERIIGIEKNRLGEIKPSAGQEEARLYIGHGEYIARKWMSLLVECGGQAFW